MTEQQSLGNRRHVFQCTNCGTTWYPEPEMFDEEQISCPTCHMLFDRQEFRPMPILSVTDLEIQLDELIRQARASGLESEVILDVLRNELEFAAELDQVGHRFMVQIIDLGIQQGDRSVRSTSYGRQLPANHRGNM